MIEAWITGEESLKARLAAIPGNVRARLTKEVTSLAIDIQTAVKAGKLSGQALKVRTGTLRRSVARRVEDTPTGVIGVVGTNVPYGKVHEYGYDETVDVREHIRRKLGRERIKNWRKMAKEQGVRLTRAMLAWDSNDTNPVAATVSAHTRHMKFPERSFLRSTLREFEPSIRERLSRAVREGAAAR